MIFSPLFSTFQDKLESFGLLVYLNTSTEEGWGREKDILHLRTIHKCAFLGPLYSSAGFSLRKSQKPCL